MGGGGHGLWRGNATERARESYARWRAVIHSPHWSLRRAGVSNMRKKSVYSTAVVCPRRGSRIALCPRTAIMRATLREGSCRGLQRRPMTRPQVWTTSWGAWADVQLPLLNCRVDLDETALQAVYVHRSWSWIMHICMCGWGGRVRLPGRDSYGSRAFSSRCACG